MQFKMRVPVKASKQEVWKSITDFETAADRISGIDEIEILNKPAEGLVGLKWKETRTMFGKTATETMTNEMTAKYLIMARSLPCALAGILLSRPGDRE